GGRRSRTEMADEATRLFGKQRPVPTGNVLQAQPARSQYSLRLSDSQLHESSHSKRGRWRVVRPNPILNPEGGPFKPRLSGAFLRRVHPHCCENRSPLPLTSGPLGSISNTSVPTTEW